MRPPSIPFIIAPNYQEFVETELLKGLDIDPHHYWRTLSSLILQFGPKQTAQLEKRAEFQQQLDIWYAQNPHCSPEAQEDFMRSIGYIVPEGAGFKISTKNIDSEISEVPGPQLVVPISNARYAINAANARYGSLFDALYGTDLLGTAPPAGKMNAERINQVFDWVHKWLDETFPLVGLSHSEVTSYKINKNALQAFKSKKVAVLKSPDAFKGFIGKIDNVTAILLQNNGLHVLLRIDSENSIGKLHPANIADIEVESAMSAIMDMEDSTTTVDSYDKVAAYRNLLGLMRGDLEENIIKNDKKFTRRLNSDEIYQDIKGHKYALKKRALLLIRNVGHQMTNPTVRNCSAVETYEGLLDAITTVVAGLHDINGKKQNSSTNSIYVVKPKMHGPDEVLLTDQIFAFLEAAFSLPQYTVKLGIMDEERRTSINLKECIRAAKDRVAFINTGFLDRTGDEIHTAMKAGAFLPKSMIKKQKWIAAYEARNVEIGLQCGLYGKAQIGKGMWAMPDLMADMYAQKINHPLAGANCAWVPSPTAATIHALHYHQVNVKAIQKKMLEHQHPNRLFDLLEVPLMNGKDLTDEEILHEAENNAQTILGYVVKWVDQGIGCSKVLDINNVGLMEDRATCRISSQLLANWLLHNVITAETMMDIMHRMASVVDEQNSSDPHYTPMMKNCDSLALQAAIALVFQGCYSASGYTEPILHTFRRLKNTKPN